MPQSVLLHRPLTRARGVLLGKASTNRIVNRGIGGLVTGQGSTGNVIAALASFFIPGLGQLIQGRLLKAIFMFGLAIVLWFFLLGWLIHLRSILDAAMWKPKS